MNSIYEIEKRKLSTLQSNFHKLLNSLQPLHSLQPFQSQNNSINLQKLLEINNDIDILIAKIIDLNESIFINTNTNTNTNKKIKNKIETINNDNKALNAILPILLMYRMSLKP